MWKGFFKTTNYWKKYWVNRSIDFEAAYFTPNHSHREVIVNKLKGFNARSILEVGCAAGANLYKIKQSFPWMDVGGVDWNAEAIEVAKQKLPLSSILQVGEATDVYISSKGADIILSDMCYIYLDKRNFRKALLEAKRIARIGVIFCEFHHKNWFMRKLLRWTSGYNSYDYEKEMKRVGFNDIEFYKLTEQDWPGGEPQKTYGHVVVARV